MTAAAPPPQIPTLKEARYAARMGTIGTAQLFDGRETVSRRCPIDGRRRVCMVRIIGPVPMRLRVTVRITPSTYLISARPVD